MGQNGERDEERTATGPEPAVPEGAAEGGGSGRAGGVTAVPGASPLADPRDEPAPKPGDGRTLSGTPLSTAGGEEGGLPTVGIVGQPYGTRPGEVPSASPPRATPEDEEARGASSPEGLLARTGRHGHDEPG